MKVKVFFSWFQALSLTILLSLSSGLNAESIHKNGHLNFQEFAEICLEGEADARDGAEYEVWCELYLAGYAQALVASKTDNICISQELNWLDKLRWDFVYWYYQNKAKHQNSLASGMLAFFQEKYGCGTNQSE
ncbi:hypothetical protein C9J12_22565 [Photobacterium frigidiphilum]|uniref:Rap1a immunity protein domain-containing protein n=1 Tax=Photobacterium frigidiphilum TaxID=264736 RepID=A0A2T3J9K7_9GAMM|nr:hypothetical protein [Photobacterium frigidiphilum]PSU45489.1 hypothetical protein C9J12_22565 [Photobacterium frigidiphilum]